MTENDILNVSARFLRRYRGLKQFEVVVADSHELPSKAIQERDQVAGLVRGSETLFLCRDRIKKPAEIEQCLRHEIFGHAIMDSLPKNIRERMLDDMHYALCRDPDFRKKYDEMVAKEYGGEINHDTLEEYFARVAEGKIELKFGEKLIANIREIFRAALNKANMNFPINDLDVRHFLNKEISRIATGEHVLSSQNKEALQRNQPFLARLDDFEARVSMRKDGSAKKEQKPQPRNSSSPMR